MALEVDVFEYATHVNSLNLKLQGKDYLMCDLLTQVKAFRAKLILLENRVTEYNFMHFPCCEKLNTKLINNFQPHLQ